MREEDTLSARGPQVAGSLGRVPNDMLRKLSCLLDDAFLVILDRLDIRWHLPCDISLQEKEAIQLHRE